MKLVPAGLAELRGRPRFLWSIVCVLLALNNPSIAGTWETKANLPTPEIAAGVSAINGLLYVAGGYNNGGLATLQAFDPSLNQWTTLAAMPDSRYASETGVINSQLYVVGGWFGSLPTNTLFIYDPPSNTSPPFPI